MLSSFILTNNFDDHNVLIMKFDELIINNVGEFGTHQKIQAKFTFISTNIMNTLYLVFVGSPPPSQALKLATKLATTDPYQIR